MFDDFTTQVQSDEFASFYEELSQALAETAKMEWARVQGEMDDIEMSQAEAEWTAWEQKAFPTPTDEELDAMERDYYENYGQ